MDNDTANPDSPYVPDANYVGRVFHIESGGNPNAVTGSNRGLAQFGPAEERQYGITDANRTDPNAQSAAVLREAANHGPILSRALGRAPTAGEYYLTHQQGIAGGPALLTADEGMPAWKAIRPFYRSDAVAQRAITGNIPRGSELYGVHPDQITAGAFRNFWVSKFEGHPGPVVAGPVPSAPAGSVEPGARAGSAAPIVDSTLKPAVPQFAEDMMQPTPIRPVNTNLARIKSAIAQRQPVPPMRMPPSVQERLAAVLSEGKVI